ncbi:hypothetical protein ACFOWE_28995 [Planomonospora corallina]|uniref:Uncharacterized protein n=1 Tax=Planomonospora corallina TaxID=1806052 RepID=A0ABV8IFS0_9ACTN
MDRAGDLDRVLRQRCHHEALAQEFHDGSSQPAERSFLAAPAYSIKPPTTRVMMPMTDPPTRRADGHRARRSRAGGSGCSTFYDLGDGLGDDSLKRLTGHASDTPFQHNDIVFVVMAALTLLLIAGMRTVTDDDMDTAEHGAGHP